MLISTAGDPSELLVSRIVKTVPSSIVVAPSTQTVPMPGGKAEAYKRGLGYTEENARELRDKIHFQVSSGKSVPYEIQKSEYGTKCKYRISITGPNGKTKNVIAVYQIDNGTTVPRMITNYLEGENDDN